MVIFFPVTTNAAQYQKFGDFTVYYNSISSTLIPQQVAVVHDIIRAENRVVTNISIKRKDTPVKARVTGFSTNLINQTSVLAFTEVLEQSAIYYLANSVVGRNDTLRFNITIEIEDYDASILLTFRQSYY